MNGEEEEPVNISYSLKRISGEAPLLYEQMMSVQQKRECFWAGRNLNIFLVREEAARIERVWKCQGKDMMEERP